ncbi:Uncharacterized protein TCM_019109 [Theobroma cacao]|uniref:Uncharacterized protein n=1 Tax=Theobroma cacao TaxID=3641 RepID=A0A061EGV3_THECC|nr:Uncharacterized protein TCM_019109 [Theobroma cacao]
MHAFREQLDQRLPGHNEQLSPDDKDADSENPREIHATNGQQPCGRLPDEDAATPQIRDTNTAELIPSNGLLGKTKSMKETNWSSANKVILSGPGTPHRARDNRREASTDILHPECRSKPRKA